MPLTMPEELTDPTATNTQMKQRLAQLAANATSKEEFLSGLEDNLVEVDLKSEDLFAKDIQLGYTNSMPVIRFTGESTSNTYAAGTYQTRSGSKVQLSVPASGSAAIKHYFETGIAARPFEAEFTVTLKNAPPESVGVGFKNGSTYSLISLSGSGNLVSLSGYSSSNIKTGLGTYDAGDTVKFVYDGTNVKAYVNNVFRAEAPLTQAGTIIVGQSGFSRYLSMVSGGKIDPIRDYVKGQIASATVNAQSPGYYSYSADTKTFMAYSQVKGNLYVGFEVQRETDMSDLIYKDYWRMLQAAFYTYENGTMQATGRTAVVGGENEFVFRQNSTKDDFTGGYHGDELVTDIKLMVDGFPISTLSNIPLTAANKVEYIEKSTMHETASGGVVVEGHPVIAYHTKHTSFKDGGYKTWNHVKWNYAGTMSTLYHGISCISKDVASVGFSDDTFTDASFTGSNNNFFTAIGTRLFKGRNPASGLAVEATSRQIKVNGADELSELFIKDRTEDSKYYRKSPPRIVEVGEIHESYFECKFMAI